ncbi:MAG: hypothetical protein ACHRXM_35200 [Isosphaerales bacterium]
MNGDSSVDRCPWEDRVLGRPSSLRRALTIPLLVLLGGGVAYVQFNHASRPREELFRSLGAVLSDIAVPEPLFKEAQKVDGSRVFEEYATYREFLETHGLAQSVLITRTCSEEGVFLFHAFPPLDDPNTFSHFIARLPNLVPGRAHGQPPTDRTQVHPLPALQLSTRSAAEEFLSTGFFLLPSFEETRIPGGASAQRGEGEESQIGVRARGQQDSTPSAERR